MYLAVRYGRTQHVKGLLRERGGHDLIKEIDIREGEEECSVVQILGCHITPEILGVRPDPIQKPGCNFFINREIKFLKVLGEYACRSPKTGPDVRKFVVQFPMCPVLVMVKDNMECGFLGVGCYSQPGPGQSTRARYVHSCKREGVILSILISSRFTIVRFSCVADESLVKNPAFELCGVCMTGNCGKGHCRGYRIRVRILVGDDAKGSFPTRKDLLELLRDPVRIEFAHLEEGTSCNDFRWVKDLDSTGFLEGTFPKRVDRPGYNMSCGISCRDCTDRDKIGFLVTCEYKCDLKFRYAR